MGELDSKADATSTVTELPSTAVAANVPAVRSFRLSLHGVTVELCTLGASIVKFRVPPDDVDIVLGFDDIQEMWSSNNPPYFGVIPGRVANRIKKGQLQLQPNGPVRHLEINNPPNHLHGGFVGFSNRIWDATMDSSGVTFQLVSKDGDQLYPGTVKVSAHYSLRPTPSLSAVRLCLDLKSHLIGGHETPINLTQHTYFNLAGHDAADGVLHHSLQLHCNEYTPVDATSIPTRQVMPLDQDPVMDWRNSRTIGAAILDYAESKANLSAEQARRDQEHRDESLTSSPYGFDHNYVVCRETYDSLATVGVLFDPSTGRRLTVRSTAPGVQVYSANYLDGSISAKGAPEKKYQRWQGLCLETQHFPDSVLVDPEQQPEFAAGKCPILTSQSPHYDQSIEYTLEVPGASSGHSAPIGLYTGLPRSGVDNNGVTYQSVAEMEETFRWKDTDGRREWYEGAASYYEDKCESNLEGVLGGFASLSDADLIGSFKFLLELEAIRPDIALTSAARFLTRRKACECGAGIGRVSKGLLLPKLPGIATSDLIESSATLISAAPDYMGDNLSSRCRFFCIGLQDWEPAVNSYSLIWIQWALSYLTDDDIVSFFRRCALSLSTNGVIVLKENVCQNQEFEIDVDDCSVIRSGRYWERLIHSSGLRILHTKVQSDFPEEIYPVPMLALVPSARQGD